MSAELHLDRTGLKSPCRGLVLLSVAAAGALAAGAAPTATVAVEDYVTCVPVVTATFDEGAGDVTFQWSDAEDGTYSTLGTTASPSGTTCAYTNSAALVAAKRWYRVQVGGETSDAVAFTRFRQLERDGDDQSHGLKLDYVTMTGNITPFNDNETQAPDLGCPIGVNFKRQMYIAGVRILPKGGSSRTKGKAIYAATQFDDYASHQVQIGTCTPCASDIWYFYPSTDTENTYQCVYYSPDCGSIRQMRIYGWTPEDLANNRGNTEFSFTGFETTNHYPIVTCTFERGATNVALQAGKSASGNFTDLVRVENPTGTSFVHTNTAAKVGEKKFYRVRTVRDGEVYTSTALAFTRFRWLERDPDAPTAVRSGYTVIGDKQTFDNSLSTYGTEGNWNRGINFGEKVFIAGCRFYPRSAGALSRLLDRSVYGYVDAASYSAGTSVALSAKTWSTACEWIWRECADQDNGYQYCIFVPQYGNCAEMQIYGWTEQDVEDVGASVMPTHLTVVSGSTVGSADLTWSGAHFISRYYVEYRKEGDSGWMEAAEPVDGQLTSTTVTGLDNATTYEFRLRCLGEDLDEDYSPVAEAFIFKYTPGSGTGLRAMLMGNCTLNTKTASQRTFFEHRVFAGVNVSTNVLFADAAHTNAPQALVCFRGRIKIPVAGTYTLKIYAQNSDGVALRLDGSSWFNKLNCGGYASAAQALAAGEHAIEIDWLSLNTAKECRFTWACEGVFAEETVPVSELFPAAESDLPNYSHPDFDFLLPTSGTSIPRLTISDGGRSFTLNNMNTSGWNRNYFTTVSRLIHGGEFIFDFTVTSAGANSLFIASPDSNDYQVGFFSEGGGTRYVGSGSANDASSADRGTIANSWEGWSKGTPYKMRWVRKPQDRLKMQVMCLKGTNANKWLTINDFGVTDKGHFDKPVLRVGFTSYGSSSMSVTNCRLILTGTILTVR